MIQLKMLNLAKMANRASPFLQPVRFSKSLSLFQPNRSMSSLGDKLKAGAIKYKEKLPDNKRIKPKELLKTTPEDTYNVDSFVRAASFAGLKGLGIATIVAAATVPLPIPLQVPIAIGGTLTYIGSLIGFCFTTPTYRYQSNGELIGESSLLRRVLANIHFISVGALMGPILNALSYFAPTITAVFMSMTAATAAGLLYQGVQNNKQYSVWELPTSVAIAGSMFLVFYPGLPLLPEAIFGLGMFTLFTFFHALEVDMLKKTGYPDPLDAAVVLFGNVSEIAFGIVRGIIEVILAIFH